MRTKERRKQPSYTTEQVEKFTNDELARKLDGWADAREAVSRRREKNGEEPLDAKLLREASKRLRAVYHPWP